MSSTTSQLHDQYVSILPQINRAAHIAFHTLPDVDREEAIAETIAHAWGAFTRLVQRGKNPLLFPTALARYSVLSVKAGKLLGRRNNRRDLVSRFRKRPKDFEIVSLEAASGDQGPAWREVLTENRLSTPAETAASRIDFARWLGGLKRRARRIAVALAEGNRPMEVARKFKLSPARISQIREEFRRSWAAFQNDAKPQEGQLAVV